MVAFRIARQEDAGAARAIAQAAYAPYLPRMDRRPAPMDADFAAAIAAGQLYMAEVGGEVTGYIHGYRRGDEWHIENLAVQPDAHGQGLGKALTGFAERLAAEAGCEELTLYTNVAMQEAVGFYQALGFTETDRRRENGFDRVYFARPVPVRP